MGTPTTVTYRGDMADFPTQKEAYIWLIKKLFHDYPELLQEKSIIQGRAVNYFYRSPEQGQPE